VLCDALLISLAAERKEAKDHKIASVTEDEDEQKEEKQKGVSTSISIDEDDEADVEEMDEEAAAGYEKAASLFGASSLAKFLGLVFFVVFVFVVCVCPPGFVV
jgi:hypothetical protein